MVNQHQKLQSIVFILISFFGLITVEHPLSGAYGSHNSHQPNSNAYYQLQPPNDAYGYTHQSMMPTDPTRQIGYPPFYVGSGYRPTSTIPCSPYPPGHFYNPTAQGAGYLPPFNPSRYPMEQNPHLEVVTAGTTYGIAQRQPPLMPTPISSSSYSTAGLLPIVHSFPPLAERIFGAYRPEYSDKEIHRLLKDIIPAMMSPHMKRNFRILFDQKQDVTAFFNGRSIDQCVGIAKELAHNVPERIVWWNAKCRGLPSPITVRKHIASHPSDLSAVSREQEQALQQAAQAEIDNMKDAAKLEIARFVQEELQKLSAQRDQLEEDRKALDALAKQQSQPVEGSFSSAKTAEEKSPIQLPDGIGITLPEPAALEPSTSTAQPCPAKTVEVEPLQTTMSTSQKVSAEEQEAPAQLPQKRNLSQVASVGKEEVIDKKSPTLSSPTARPIEVVTAQQTEQKKSETTNAGKKKEQSTQQQSATRSVKPTTLEKVLTPAKQRKNTQNYLNQLERQEQLPETKAQRRQKQREQAEKEQQERAEKQREQAEQQARLQREQAAQTRTLTKQKEQKKESTEAQLLQEAQEAAQKEAEELLEAKLEFYRTNRAQLLDPEKNKMVFQRTKEQNVLQAENFSILVESYLRYEDEGNIENADKQAATIENRYDSQFNLSVFFLERSRALLNRLEKNKKSTTQLEREKILKQLDIYHKKLTALESFSLALLIDTERLLKGFHSQLATCRKTEAHENEDCSHAKICSLDIPLKAAAASIFLYQAECLSHGWGVARDQEKSKTLLEKASEQGNPEAQIIIGAKATPEDIEAWKQLLSNPQEERRARSFLDGYALAHLRGKPGDNIFKRFGNGIFGPLFEDICNEVFHKILARNRFKNLWNEGLELVQKINPKDFQSYFSSRKDSVNKHKQAKDLVLIFDYVKNVFPTQDSPTISQVRQKAGGYACHLRQLFPDLAPSLFVRIKQEEILFPEEELIKGLEKKLPERSMREKKAIAQTDCKDFCLSLTESIMVIHKWYSCETCSKEEWADIAKRLVTIRKSAQEIEEYPTNKVEERPLKLFLLYFGMQQLEERIAYISPEANEAAYKKLKKKRKEWVEKLNNYREKSPENLPLVSVVNATEALMYLDGIHPDQEGKSDKEKEQLIKEKVVPLIQSTPPTKDTPHQLLTTVQGILTQRGYLFTELTPQQREKKAVTLLTSSIASDCLDQECLPGCLHNPHAMRELARILWEKEKIEAPKNTLSRVEQLLIKAQENDDRARDFLAQVLWEKAVNGSTKQDSNRFGLALRLCFNLHNRGYKQELESMTEMHSKKLDRYITLLEQLQSTLQKPRDLKKSLTFAEQICAFSKIVAPYLKSQQRDQVLNILSSLYRDTLLDENIEEAVRVAQETLMNPVLQECKAAFEGKTPFASKIQEDVYQILTSPRLAGEYNPVKHVQELSDMAVSDLENIQKNLEKAYERCDEATLKELNNATMLLTQKLFEAYQTHQSKLSPLQWCELFGYLDQKTIFSKKQKTMYQNFALSRIKKVTSKELNPLESRPVSEVLEILKLYPVVAQLGSTLDAKQLLSGLKKDQPLTLPAHYNKELVDVAQTFCAFVSAHRGGPIDMLSDHFKALCTFIMRDLSIRQLDDTLSSEELEAYACGALYFAQGLSMVTDQESQLKPEIMPPLINQIELSNSIINQQKPEEYKKIALLVTKMIDLIIFNMAQEKESSTGKTNWGKTLKTLRTKNSVFKETPATKFVEEQVKNNPTFRKNLIINGIAEFKKPLNLSSVDQSTLHNISPGKLEEVVGTVAMATSGFIKPPSVTASLRKHAEYLTYLEKFGSDIENLEKIADHLKYIIQHKSFTPEESLQFFSWVTSLRKKSVVAFTHAMSPKDGNTAEGGRRWLSLLRFAIENSGGTMALEKNGLPFYLSLAMQVKDELEVKLHQRTITLNEAVELAGLYSSFAGGDSHLTNLPNSLLQFSSPSNYQEHIETAERLLLEINKPKPEQSLLLPMLTNSVAAVIKEHPFIMTERTTVKDFKNYIHAQLLFMKGLMLVEKLEPEVLVKHIARATKLCKQFSQDQKDTEDVTLKNLPKTIRQMIHLLLFGFALEKEGTLETTAWGDATKSLLQEEFAMGSLENIDDPTYRTEFIQKFRAELPSRFIFSL